MAIALHLSPSPLVISVALLLIPTLYLPNPPYTAASSRALRSGFTTDLIHRDFSPISPLNKSTHARRYSDALRRTVSRLRHRFNMHVADIPAFHLDAAQSDVSTDDGEYLIKIPLGTPPLDVYAIADTGSDLFWAQCQPCDQCYPQKKPAYNPRASSTYVDIPCKTQQCHLLHTTFCDTWNPGKCNYTYGYASSALTKGVLATETLTFGSTKGEPVSLQKFVFGCGHNNTGGFNPNEMGLFGLGRGPISLISQMGSTLGGKRFSQCLVPFHTEPGITSKMKFGSGSEVSGPGTVTTSLVAKQDPTYYFVTLNGISVGSVYVAFNPSGGAAVKGNMFLDSGTPPTIVPKNLYDALVAEVKKAIKLTPIDDPQLRPQLCYGPEIQVQGPLLTAHFDGGADVELKQSSTFIEAKAGIFCFAMASTDSDGGIFGNFAQSSHLIGFDLERNMVSFRSTDCTKQQ